MAGTTEARSEPRDRRQEGSPERTTVRLFGLTIDDLSMAETIARIDSLISAGGVHQHVAVNVDKVVKAQRDPGLRSIINGSDVVSVDGQPVVWASRLLGRPLPERVTGIDLMERLIAHAAVAGHRLYFLGARDDVLERVVARVRLDHPGAIVAGARNGYWPPESDHLVATEVASASPDVLFLALPSPAKERFLDRWKGEMGARFVMGVGGSFDVYAGAIPRAPRVLQRFGLEWLYRLIQEPRRMWRRYLVDDLRFLPILLDEWRRTRPGRTVMVNSSRPGRSGGAVGTGSPGRATDRPMRILVVTNLYPSPTSPSFGTFVAARVEALRRAGAEVDVAANRDDGVHRRTVAKYLRLAGSATSAGFKQAVRRRRYDVVEAHIAFPTGWIAWPVALLHRAPLVLFVHGSDVNDVSVRTKAHRFASRTLFRQAERVVVNSEYMLPGTVRFIGGGGVDRVVIQSPGIDFDLFSGRANEPVGSRSGLLFVGRLTAQKGIDELLAALQLLAERGRRLPLTIIGTGPDRLRLEEIARTSDLSILIDGPRPPEAVAEAMRRCDILVVPSVFREALGLVAIEGMAAGAIVVASRTGGLAETVIEGVTGIQCEPADAASLAEAIERALALVAEPMSRTAFVERARAMARSHDLNLIAAQSLADYRELIEAHA